MDDPLLMSRLHGPGERLDQLRRRSRWPGCAVEPVRQAAAVHEFQREERPTFRLANLVNLHNVGVLQVGDGFGLGAKAEQVRFSRVTAGQDHLQRHQAIER
jgi:hypothetical protein